jgi:hypothetical protein
MLHVTWHCTRNVKMPKSKMPDARVHWKKRPSPVLYFFVTTKFDPKASTWESGWGWERGEGERSRKGEAKLSATINAQNMHSRI